jgi:hypothetical protein
MLGTSVPRGSAKLGTSVLGGAERQRASAQSRLRSSSDELLTSCGFGQGFEGLSLPLSGKGFGFGLYPDGLSPPERLWLRSPSRRTSIFLKSFGFGRCSDGFPASTFRKGFGFGLHPDGLSPPKEQLASAAAVRDSRTDFGPDEYRRRFVGRTFVPTTCGSGGRARVSPVGFGRSGREITTRVSAPKAARRGAGSGPAPRW